MDNNLCLRLGDERNRTTRARANIQYWNQADCNIQPTNARVNSYGELSRLKTVNYGDGQTQDYGFDAMGNRASKPSVQGGTTTNETYICDNLNELDSRSVNGSSQTYNNELVGNTLTNGNRTNTWDSRNSLIQCAFGGKTSQMTYGADGSLCRCFTLVPFLGNAHLFRKQVRAAASSEHHDTLPDW